MAWVGTKGLNAWVIVLSGELSMTSVLDEPEPFDPVVEALDPHAAAPAARRAAAALTATSFLGPVNLEIILVIPVVERWRPPISAVAG
jgi:hypothetical protein